MTAFLKRLWADDKGQDLIEYALIAGFLAVAAGAAMPVLSPRVNAFFAGLKAHLAGLFH